MASTTHKPAVRDEAVKENTGRPWKEWFELLEAWGAKDRTHTEIAKHLVEQGVPSWWSQTLTVEYERAIGRRAVGQRTGGDYEVSVQRTMAADPAIVLKAWTDAKQRDAWLRDATLRTGVRTGMQSVTKGRNTQGQVLRFRLPAETGPKPQRVEVTARPKDTGTVLHVQHYGLLTAGERDRLKTRWANALDALRDHLAEPE